MPTVQRIVLVCCFPKNGTIRCVMALLLTSLLAHSGRGRFSSAIAVLKSVFATLQSNQIGPAMNYSSAGDKTTGGTPLYLAAKLNMPAAADFFLDHGASMVRRDPDSGMSPLEVAEACQSSSVLDMFVDRVSKLENSAKKLSSLSIERDQHPNKRRRCQRMDMGEVP